MMLVSFDPADQQERDSALAVIQLWSGQAEPAPAATTAEPEPAPAPAAEPAPVSNGLDAQAGVELDANGTPWLAEAHATTKTKTVAGVWKAKRGVDKADIAAMEQTAREKIAGTPEPVVPTEPVVAPAEMPTSTVTIDEVSTLWQTAMDNGLIGPNDHVAIYQQLGIDGGQLAVNETMRVSLANYLTALLNPAPAVPVQGGLPGMGG